MSEDGSPLIPTGYDVAWSLSLLLLIALTVAALVSLTRSANRLTVSQGLLWAALVVLLPVIGPVAWLSAGRRTAARQGD
jgi:hypothetical protein